MTRAQFQGCLMGLALGDACGAPYEGGPLERLVWWLIGTTRQGGMRWTDDTQMSLDLAETLIECGFVQPDKLAWRFARNYRWSRGYGPGAARLLKRIRRGESWEVANRAVFRDGSFGNGGAMRSPILGLCFAGDVQELLKQTRIAASITHAHPAGIEGAVLVAVATAELLKGSPANDIPELVANHCRLESFTSRLQTATDWLSGAQDQSPAQVRRVLGNSVSAAESCVTALYIALRHLPAPFENLLTFARQCGGDVDTISAMAGALWGASHGSEVLSERLLARLEQRPRLAAVADQLYDRFAATTANPR